MGDVRSGIVIAGKYRLEEPIAQGGMGSVWRGRHLTLETSLAVKFIAADVAAREEARRRFEREAKAAALLQSPHVVQIYDYGMDGDLPYLVMELLSGEDLAARLKRRRRLSPEETASVVTQVARALRRAAEAGIVHRDLKPSNVFIIGGEEDEEHVKVLDFGVAKAPRTLHPDDETTKLGAVIGSPRYMSPEQARGSPLVDPRSDLWSLAVIAYRALTGDLPFNGTDVTDLVLKICSETPTPPSTLDPSLGPEMDAFFARALDRDPAARYQTARELARAFAVAAGVPPASTRSLGQLNLAALTKSDHALRRIVLGDDASPPTEPPRPSPRPPAFAAERTRDDVTPAEPAISHRAAHVPKETPTPKPGSIDVHTPGLSPSSPQALARRLAIGVAGGALLGAVLVVLAHGGVAQRAPGASDAVVPAPPSAAPMPASASADVAPPPATADALATHAASATPERDAPPHSIPPANAETAEPHHEMPEPGAYPSAAPPRRAPHGSVPLRAPSKKRNAILGI